MRRQTFVAWILAGISLLFLAYAVVEYRDQQALRRAVLERRYEAYLNDAGVRPFLLYNLGSDALREALTQLRGDRLQAALAYLRQALVERPDFPEARHNYEVALALLSSREQQSSSPEGKAQAQKQVEPKEEVLPSFFEWRDI